MSLLKTITTLYIDDSSIRVLVTSGLKVKKWAETSLEPGLIEGMVVNDTDKVGDIIRELFDKEKIPSGTVVLGLSALHSLTRPLAFPQMPKNLLPEAVIREARRVLPVPPDQLYISWQRLPSKDDRIQVFLVALRRKTVESVIAALKHARIRTTNIGIKPLSLGQLVPEEKAVLVDVQETEFDIIVVSDGIPQPIRTISLPREKTSKEQKVSTIIKEVERTINFFNSNSAAKVNENTPMYISGELVHEPEICRQIARPMGNRYKVLQAPVYYRGEWNENRYLVNKGLAFKHPSLKEFVGPSFISVNLLPPELFTATVNWSKVAIIPGLALVAAAVIYFVFMISATSANINTTRAQINKTNETLLEKQADKRDTSKGLTSLENTLAARTTLLEQYQAMQATIDQKGQAMNGDLTAAVQNLPDGTSLTNIGWEGYRLTVKGAASQEATVLDYAGRLSKTGRWLQTTIANMTRDDETGGFTFSIILNNGELNGH